MPTQDIEIFDEGVGVREKESQESQRLHRRILAQDLNEFTKVEFTTIPILCRPPQNQEK